MKYPCNLIKDILPLYYDGVTSAESEKAVQEHFEECSECKAYYDKMCKADVIEVSAFDEAIAKQTADSFREMSKKVSKKMVKTFLKMLLIILLAAVGVALGLWLWVVSYASKTAEESWEVHSDINEYGMLENGQNVISESTCWGKIWPEEITDGMDVQEYVLIHYCPFDSNYLGYLEVKYSEADYEMELARLEQYPSTDYAGRYGAGEFVEYKLLAMDDSNSHFVYALEGENATIIYVSMFFPGYSMDIDYEAYIPKKCLPEGLDLSEDNPVRQKMLEESEASLKRYKEMQKKKKAQ